MQPRVAGRIIYPIHERFLRRPTFPYLADLERSQWLSRAEVEALQARKLEALLRLARDHCPWYAERIQEAGVDVGPDVSLTLDDLRKLPLMTKTDASANRDRLAWKGVPGGAYEYNTGGSSGEPLIFYFGRWRQASDAAGRMRARRWWGVEPGEREVYLWGAPVELNNTDRVKTLRDRLFNQLVLNAFEMSPMKMDDYLRRIRAFRPRCVYGYASSIALLAAHARSRDEHLHLPELKVVCVTGEPLYPHQRAIIEDAFGVPVANEFGSRDIGFTAHESPEGQMLLMSESIVLEVLDDRGEPAAPGEVGEAVMTGLCSQAQPFVRYRTGDMVRASDDVCAAGRGLHVLGDIFGRTTDFVVRADGTIMHALAVIYVLRAVEGVREFKFLQHAVDDVEVLLIPSALWSEISHRAVIQGLQQRLGDGVRIRLRLVDEIEAEASGKYRYVVSRVPLPDSLNDVQQGLH